MFALHTKLPDSNSIPRVKPVNVLRSTVAPGQFGAPLGHAGRMSIELAIPEIPRPRSSLSVISGWSLLNVQPLTSRPGMNS